jgi:hypothetical protein
MKYIVTQRLDSALLIQEGKQLEIDGFVFLLQDGGNNAAKFIQTEVEANTSEEAQRKAINKVTQFLAKLTVLDNSSYNLLGIFSVKAGMETTRTADFTLRVNVGNDGELIKAQYEKTIKNKKLRIWPLRHYSEGINSADPFEKFRSFYRVLENDLKTRQALTDWIQKKEPTIEMKTDMHNHRITILTWIRHKLSHAKIKNEGLTPLSISKPEDVALVQKYLPIIQNLAREIIREEEKI